MDSRVAQWMDVARVAVEFSTRLKPGEDAVVVRDTSFRDYPGWADLADAVFVAARYVGAKVTQIECLPLAHPNDELPATVAGAMASADVIYLGLTAFHTQATRKALAGGARLLGIMGCDSAANTRGAGRGLDLAPRSAAEAEEWGKLTTRVADLFRGGGTLHATTKKGTDVTCEIGELEVHAMDALYREPGSFTHLIPGLPGGGTTPGTTEGTLVVDASITPIRRPLTNEDPVVLRIEKGYVVDVSGGPAAKEWKHRADALNDPLAFNVAEYGIGTHPKARTPVGWPLEDERMYGAFHLGIGTNTAFGGKVQSRWHIDGSATAATVTLNGKLIVENGDFRV